jgi:hypothetical protein
VAEPWTTNRNRHEPGPARFVVPCCDRRNHVKGEQRMGRNYLKGREGNRANAVLAAAGYNFSLLLLRRFEWLLRALILIFCSTHPRANAA